MKRHFLCISTSLLLAFSSTCALAALPKHGQTKAQVARTQGAPEKKLAAVGKPPISRWVYKDFTVYFEYDHVVQAVPNKR